MNEIETLLEAALRAVDPAECVRSAVRSRDGALLVDGHAHRPEGRLAAVAIGKAAEPMLDGLRGALGAAPDLELVITKHPTRPASIRGDHPVPGPRSVAAARRLRDFVSDLGRDDLLVCLISGGGSSLVCAPAPNLTLEDYALVTGALLGSGADIEEINTVRRRIDVLKGGGLARLCPAQIVTLILSDVVGDSLAAVASGLTTPDPATLGAAEDVLRKYGLESWTHALRTPFADVPLVQHAIVANNRTAMDAAIARATQLGYHTHVWTDRLAGPAAAAGRDLAARLAAYDGPRPAALFAGGETTVRVTGPGRGGRNLELALAAAEHLDGIEHCSLTAVATDGEDGSTNVAGATVDGATVARARSLGLDAPAALAANDSLGFFGKAGGLIRLGPTGTNVNDLVLGLAHSVA